MASWREIERIRKDIEAARSIARRLLAAHADALTDWELDFLEGILKPEKWDELTTRQAEKLLEIRDGLEFVTEHHGYSIAWLLKSCYEARLDLPEDDEEWVVELHAAFSGAVRRARIGRLMYCARQLHLIDEF